MHRCTEFPTYDPAVSGVDMHVRWFGACHPQSTVFLTTEATDQIRRDQEIDRSVQLSCGEHTVNSLAHLQLLICQ